MKLLYVLLFVSSIAYALEEVKEGDVRDVPIHYVRKAPSANKRRKPKSLLWQSQYGSGADVDAALKSKQYSVDKKNAALLMASECGNSDSVTILLAAGAHVHARNGSGFTALHMAVKPSTVAMLLGAQADIDMEDNCGSTPLLRVLANNNFCVASELVRSGAALNKPNNEGWQPLHVASIHGKETFAKKLLDAKVHVDPVGQDGATPLHFACEKGHLQVVQLLLEHKAAVNAPSSRSNEYFQTNPGFATPLLLAARSYWHGGKETKYVEIMKALVAAGASKDKEKMMDYSVTRGRWGRYHIDDYMRDKEEPRDCQRSGCALQ